MSDVVTPADLAARAAAKSSEDAKPAAEDNVHEQYPPEHPLVKAFESKKNQLAKLESRLERLKDLETKAKRLDELEQATKSDAEKFADATRKIAELNAAREAAEANLVRYEVASEMGVPGNAMKFLTGSTRDEVAASAKEVMELIGDAGKPRAPKPDPNQGRTSPEATSPEAQFASFLHQQLNNS